MRLINTSTLKPEDFQSNFPSYAIASHRWTHGAGAEATLRILLEQIRKRRRKELTASQRLRKQGSRRSSFSNSASKGQTKTKTKPKPPRNVRRCQYGMNKLARLSSIAKDSGYDWLWMDTVCIDKTNNVELSEAINSMYTWYQKADCCFVYLEDVLCPADLVYRDDDRSWEPHLTPGFREQISNADWFTRGWTLQELLAPRKCIFLDRHGQAFGTKTSLARDLSLITGIPEDLLSQPASLPSYNCAQRLSWASRRDTTRGEDQAYSLLGLLDINMPLLYGEGREKAFERLQLAVLEQRDDESLFAWAADVPADCPDAHQVWFTATGPAQIGEPIGHITGIFAKSPRQFAKGMQVTSRDEWAPKLPNRPTNRGLEMHREARMVSYVTANQVSKLSDDWNGVIWAVKLACCDSVTGKAIYMFLMQECLVVDTSKNRLRRVMVQYPNTNRFGGEETWQPPDEKQFFVHTRWPAKNVQHCIE